MLTLIKTTLSNVLLVLKQLNVTSVKRIILYALLIYPVVILFLYKTEIKMLISFPSQNVQLLNIAEAQNTCFILKKKHFAETVIIYLYQPAGKNKSYKEMSVFSSGQIYVPSESIKTIQLFANSRIIEDMKNHGYSKVTSTSNHYESSILAAYNLSVAYITPIKDTTSGQIIGEVVWIFQNDIDLEVDELIRESQIFSYDIT